MIKSGYKIPEKEEEENNVLHFEMDNWIMPHGCKLYTLTNTLIVDLYLQELISNPTRIWLVVPLNCSSCYLLCRVLLFVGRICGCVTTVGNIIDYYNTRILVEISTLLTDQTDGTPPYH